jgi:uncharacterized protein YkwD
MYFIDLLCILAKPNLLTYLFMFPTTKLLCLTLVCVLSLNACSKDSVIPEDNDISKNLELSNNFAYSTMEIEILDAVNNHRKSIGLTALQKLDDITIEAVDHTQYMVDLKVVNHDHFNIRYQNLVQEIGASAVSENVGFGYRTGEAVVEAWIKSEGHRENIEGSYTHFGISVEQDQNGKNYFTNIFARR